MSVASASIGSPAVQMMHPGATSLPGGSFLADSSAVAVVGTKDGYFIVRLPGEKRLKHSAMGDGWTPTQKELEALVASATQEVLVINQVQRAGGVVEMMFKDQRTNQEADFMICFASETANSPAAVHFFAEADRSQTYRVGFGKQMTEPCFGCYESFQVFEFNSPTLLPKDTVWTDGDQQQIEAFKFEQTCADSFSNVYQTGNSSVPVGHVLWLTERNSAIEFPPQATSAQKALLLASMIRKDVKIGAGQKKRRVGEAVADAAAGEFMDGFLGAVVG